jgi:hypothetical protein
MKRRILSVSLCRILTLITLLSMMPWLCALAFIRSVQVTPATPTERDSITVSVHGVRPDGCWHSRQAECPSSNDSLAISILLYDHWTPDLYCPLEATPYDVLCRLGPLSRGSHTLLVTETHESPRFPEPQEIHVDITVIGLTPLELGSWGYLRSIFR